MKTWKCPEVEELNVSETAYPGGNAWGWNNGNSYGHNKNKDKNRGGCGDQQPQPYNPFQPDESDDGIDDLS